MEAPEIILGQSVEECVERGRGEESIFSYRCGWWECARKMVCKCVNVTASRPSKGIKVYSRCGFSGTICGRIMDLCHDTKIRNLPRWRKFKSDHNRIKCAESWMKR